MVGIVLGLHAGLVEHRGPHDGLGDRVGVAVGRRPPVLEVAEAVLAHLARDADAGAPVGHAGGELEDVGGLVVAGEPPGVVPAAPRVVDADVVVVPLAQLLDGRFDVFETPVPPHLLGAVVGVAAGPVPVARHRFGVQRGHHPEVLADAVQDEASHPEVIAHLDAFARTHLKFPLGGHHLRVGATDLHPRVETSLVVGLHDVPPVHLIRSNPTVIGALRAGEAVVGPAVGVAVDAQQRVLLLHPEPGVAVLHQVHDFLAGVPQVGLCRLPVVLEHFAQHQLVGVQAKRVPEHADGHQEHVAVGALRLRCAGAIKIPLGDIFDALGLLVEGPALAAHALAAAVDPDVGDLHLPALGQPHVLLPHQLVQPGAVRHRHGDGPAAPPLTGSL